MTSKAALLILSLAMAGTAAAQPGQAPPLPAPPPSRAEPGQPEPKLTPLAPGSVEPKTMQPLPGDERSEGVALALSLGGTVASWAMIGAAVAMDRPGSDTTFTLARVGLAGAILAPSFGHWYAGTFATRGFGLRMAGLGLATLGFIGVIVMCEDECNPTIPEALLIGGAGFVIAGTLDDLATVPGDVRRHNQRRYDTSIVPMVRRDSRSAGVSITGWF